MTRMLKRTLTPLAMAGCVLASSPASAQTTGNPEEARVHLGPLALEPRFALRHLGVDTNVFNSADLPVKDFTASLAPGVDAWLRFGKALLATQTDVEWTYFKKAAGQRAFNTTQLARLEFDLARVTPFVGGGVITTRQRPNLEIDARVRQHRAITSAGARVEFGGRSRLDVDTRRERIDFGDDGLGSDELAATLNREVTEGGVAFRMDVTPLSTVVVRTGVSYDVFEYARLRDSNSVTVLPGLEIKPSALISGKAMVGFRHFNAKSEAVPDFSGVIAVVDVGYVMREMTRFGVKVDRNLEYSFQIDKPYYIATSANVDVKQALGPFWDVVGRAGRSTLAYETFTVDVGNAFGPGQRERLITYGIGIGRRLGDHVRVGLDIDHGRRRSDAERREYEGFKVGGSFTYGY
jgi:hypothetical protein